MTHSSLFHTTQKPPPNTALKAFQARCDATNKLGLSGSNAYVDCVDGKVRSNPSQTCADACVMNGKRHCCDGGNILGNNACDGFTGKGKSKELSIHVVLSFCLVTILTAPLLLSFLFSL